MENLKIKFATAIKSNCTLGLQRFGELGLQWDIDNVMKKNSYNLFLQKPQEIVPLWIQNR